MDLFFLILEVTEISQETRQIELVLSSDLQLVLVHLTYAICFHLVGISLCLVTSYRRR